ncbi:MAG: hypothetical protein J2P36_20000 [Ktedonobacteraceae bacterium]|nr:hypothetical protein [Ktedonobacteraceae bacterium]
MEEFNARLTVLEEKVSSQFTEIKGLLLQILSEQQDQGHRLTFVEHEISNVREDIINVKQEMAIFKQDMLARMNSQGQDIKMLNTFQQRIMQKIQLEYE